MLMVTSSGRQRTGGARSPCDGYSPARTEDDVCTGHADARGDLIKALRSAHPNRKPLDADYRKQLELARRRGTALPQGLCPYESLADALLDQPDPRTLKLLMRGDQANFVRDMPPTIWAMLLNEASHAPRVCLGAELSGGGQPIVNGLKALGAVDLELPAPAYGETIDLRDVSDERSPDSGWAPQLTILRGEEDADLRHVFVPVGSRVVGRGFEGRGVQVHFTDAAGQVQRSLPLADAATTPWSGPGCKDIQPRPVAAAETEALFDEMVARVRGPVLDLSGCNNDTVHALRSLTPQQWDVWRSRPETCNVTTILMSPEVRAGGPVTSALKQVPTFDIESLSETESMRNHREIKESHAVFASQMRRVDPNLDAPLVLEKLLDSIVGDALDLSDCPQDAAPFMRSLPAKAWEAFLAHPQAAAVQRIWVSADLHALGAMPTELEQVLV